MGNENANKTKAAFVKLFDDFRPGTFEFVKDLFKMCVICSPEKRTDFKQIINIFNQNKIKLIKFCDDIFGYKLI